MPNDILEQKRLRRFRIAPVACAMSVNHRQQQFILFDPKRSLLRSVTAWIPEKPGWELLVHMFELIGRGLENYCNVLGRVAVEVAGEEVGIVTGINYCCIFEHSSNCFLYFAQL